MVGEKARSAVVNGRSSCVATAANGKVKNSIRLLFPSMSKSNPYPAGSKLQVVSPSA